MLGRLTILLAALTIGLAPSEAIAAPRNLAATHAYLAASYTLLHASVSTWSGIERGVHRLDREFAALCPDVGAGSPENEESGLMGWEVAGAIWATGFHTDAKIVTRFIREAGPLRWSNPKVTAEAHRLVRGLREMLTLPVPDLCGDVRAWKADAFRAVPPSTGRYVRHVEAIDIEEIPPRLLAPYVRSSDRGLVKRDEHLYTRYEELEIGRGQVYWNTLLETLGLNQ